METLYPICRKLLMISSTRSTSLDKIRQCTLKSLENTQTLLLTSFLNSPRTQKITSGTKESLEQPATSSTTRVHAAQMETSTASDSDPFSAPSMSTLTSTSSMRSSPLPSSSTSNPLKTQPWTPSSSSFLRPTSTKTCSDTSLRRRSVLDVPAQERLLKASTCTNASSLLLSLPLPETSLREFLCTRMHLLTTNARTNASI